MRRADGAADGTDGAEGTDGTGGTGERKGPEEWPVGFEADGYDVSGRDRITVPSNRGIEGHPHPVRPNITYPWEGYEKPGSPDVPRGRRAAAVGPAGRGDGPRRTKDLEGPR
ncbi:hypothetical protein SALBM135S_06576 [Streptomyces alboniger]